MVPSPRRLPHPISRSLSRRRRLIPGEEKEPEVNQRGLGRRRPFPQGDQRFESVSLHRRVCSRDWRQSCGPLPVAFAEAERDRIRERVLGTKADQKKRGRFSRGYRTIRLESRRGWHAERGLRTAGSNSADRGAAQSRPRFADFDLGLIGFEPDQLETILAGLRSSGLTDPDSVPEVPEQPVTQLNDLWLLGDHRVGCGDSTNSADVALVLAGAEPHLMVTDPPYGVGYEPSWRSRCKLSGGKLAQGKVLNDDRADWREAYALFLGDVAYVWHGALCGDAVAANLAGCGLLARAQIIWAKQHFTLGCGDYHWQHETCCYAVREGKTSHWQGGRTQTTVWEIPNNNPFGNPQHEQSWGHGTQKPVECMRRPIANNSRPGQAVYDPFLGSGTSVIAAEMTGRVCLGIELCPHYVDVVVRRWQLFTGRAARHQASGQSFDARAAGPDHD